MYINASDEAGQTGRALLTVNVSRNLFPPVFTTNYKRLTIDGNRSPGVTLFTVTATGQ